MLRLLEGRSQDCYTTRKFSLDSSLYVPLSLFSSILLPVNLSAKPLASISLHFRESSSPHSHCRFDYRTLLIARYCFFTSICLSYAVVDLLPNCVLHLQQPSTFRSVKTRRSSICSDEVRSCQLIHFCAEFRVQSAVIAFPRSEPLPLREIDLSQCLLMTICRWRPRGGSRTV